jgi:magnesium and cobalt exporter, CNNM family
MRETPQHHATSEKDSFWDRLREKIGILFGKRSRPVSETDVMELLDEGKRSGSIDKTEHELIKSIFEFTDTTVKEIMVPRADVVAVEISTPREKLNKILLDEGYSRVPVFRGTLDNIVGVLYTKDLLSMFEHRDVIVLLDIIRPAYLVPESKKISALLRDLQLKKQHLAIVIDEFGGVEGIVTMEDIIEEIVGEIHDEYDEELKEVETSTDGSVLINGGISIHDFNEKFSCLIPEESDYETIGGFLYKITGRIPDLHEEIRFENHVFTVTKKNERRIQQVKFKTLPRPRENEDQEGDE